MKTLIKNGTVISSEGRSHVSILIEDGKITCLAANGSIADQDVDEVIDATGLYVMPGVIDTHTHIEEPFQGLTPDEDWFDGTRNAAMGGVTTVMNFVIQQPGQPLMAEIKKDRERVEKLACIDYTFHGVFSNYSNIESVLAEIDELFDYGVPSVKVFTIYSGDGLYADDWSLYRIMQKVREKGGFVGVHAENMAIGENHQKQLIQQGKVDASYWPQAKPYIVEEEAVRRVCLLSEYTGCRAYIAHTSTGAAVRAVKEYQAKGAPVYCEGCAHYFLFDDSLYSQPGIGVWEIISPPLRKKEDQRQLWEGIRNGAVALIGSDHNAYGKVPKDIGYQKQGFAGVSNGGPGVLENAVALFAEGVNGGRITPERFVQITSTNPAKMFGLYPQKGTLSIGSDADITLWDPHKTCTMGAELYQSMDWTPYEGIRFTGVPVRTIVRGQTVMQDGEFVGNKGTGRFVFGKLDEEALLTVQ